MKSKTYVTFISAVTLFALLSFPLGASASHSWGNYHWARTSNPFNLKIVDSNTPDWDGELDLAMSDWSQSTVLNLIDSTSDDRQNVRKRCAMVTGQVRSCNANYGFNGWLGLASINITGGVHITRGTSKMNDSYFSSPSYDDTARRHVMCQEIGHTFGLDHQSENGDDLNTCMDYSSALDNPSPNSHDYQQLQTIYSHLDSTTTVGFSAFIANEFGDDPDAPHNWGQLVRQSANGRSSYYERDNGNGNKTLRHVFWTQEAADRCRGCDHRYDH
jgi:predicted Zn-dependent protease